MEWVSSDAVENSAILLAGKSAELGVAFALKVKEGNAVPTGVVIYNKKQALVPAANKLVFK